MRQWVRIHRKFRCRRSRPRWAKCRALEELPVHPEMPDVLTMNDGTKVSTVEQWQKRREEMKRMLEYYAVGQMPPPPGNVRGQEVRRRSLPTAA